MLKQALTTTIAVLTAGAIAGPAMGHEMRSFVSADGLAFIGDQVPYLVPDKIYPGDITKDVLCMTATQRDTEVEVTVHDFELTIPKPGRVRLYVNLSVYGAGTLHVDDAYACFGQMTCGNELILNDARATVDFDIMLDDGVPTAVFDEIDLQVAEDDLDVNFSGCAAGDIANWMIDFAKEYLTDYMLNWVEDMAKEKLGPAVTDMMAGVGTFEGAIGEIEFAADLDDLFVNQDGLDLGAHVDLSSQFPAAECIAEFDKGDPESIDGPIPALNEVPSHIGLAANFGLLNDALYHVWRDGMTCLTGDHMEALGIHLPLDHITEILPGFPPGTELDVEMRLTQPPQIKGALGSNINVTLQVNGIEAAMIAHLPDGTVKRMDIELDVEATAAAGINRETNALVATPTNITISRMEMDQVYAAETGFDVTRVMQVLDERMIPGILKKMGQMPLTGPVFAFGDYAVILRDLGNNDAYLTVNADLFRVPANDNGAPETSIVDYPNAPVSPENAIIRVSGTDGMIPTELLQYVVAINGEERPATYIREINVGTPGESGTHVIDVTATDLSGNADQTPARVEVTIDGVSPSVQLRGQRVRKPDGGETEMAWTMKDDMTQTEQLGARIELFEVNDKADLLKVTHLTTIELERGATSAKFQVEDGRMYRAELHVTDEVGNDTIVAVLLDAGGDGGCSIGGAGLSGSLPVGLALFLSLVLLRRRRA